MHVEDQHGGVPIGVCRLLWPHLAVVLVRQDVPVIAHATRTAVVPEAQQGLACKNIPPCEKA